jgi:hypothetical protein
MEVQPYKPQPKVGGDHEEPCINVILYLIYHPQSMGVI